MPRITYHTGAVDIHDLSFGSNGDIYAINTLFSSIIKLDENYSFTPVWTPPQIDKITSEDRCHLNGMAMLNGKPKYATAFNNGNTPQVGENITSSGVIYDIEKNKIICSGLPMPHTPRIFNNELYVLLSATGELVKIDTDNGTYDVIVKIGGFVRGMSLHKDYLIHWNFKAQKNSSTFGKLDFAKHANQAGIVIVHLPTKKHSRKINYFNSLDEIYDIHILKDKKKTKYFKYVE